MESDKELERIKKILDVMEQLAVLLVPLEENEYERVREYVNARQEINLPYSNPFIVKEKV